MIIPGLLSILSPMVVGVIFKYIFYYTKRPLLGAQAVSSFLMFSTSTGILMALFLNNTGCVGIMLRNMLKLECLEEKEVKRLNL